MKNTINDIMNIVEVNDEQDIETVILDAVYNNNMAKLAQIRVNVDVTVDGDLVTADISEQSSIVRTFSDLSVVNRYIMGIDKVTKDARHNKYIVVKHDGNKEVFDIDNLEYTDENGTRKFMDSQRFWTVSKTLGGKQRHIPVYCLVAYFNEMLTGHMRLSYDGLTVNHKRNDKFLGCEMLSSCNLEITGRGKNTAHGAVWNKIYRHAKVRTWFSAENTKFIEYIKSINIVTPQHLVNYGGFVMDGYWVVM